MKTTSRRSFLAVAPLGFAAFLQGCDPADTAVAAEFLLPIIQSAISEVVKIGLNRVFSSGATIRVQSEFPGFQYRTVSTVPGGFAGRDVGNGFATPISIHSRNGRERHIQVPQEGGLWGLMLGGKNRDAVFQIHLNWMKWILDRDTCNFTVNGNSGIPKMCGINGCQTFLSRQSFLDTEGNEKVLFLPIGTVTPEHASHSTPWIGCPVVDGTPEECF